jgi:hypothetical protein
MAGRPSGQWPAKEAQLTASRPPWPVSCQVTWPKCWPGDSSFRSGGPDRGKWHLEQPATRRLADNGLKPTGPSLNHFLLRPSRPKRRTPRHELTSGCPSPSRLQKWRFQLRSISPNRLTGHYRRWRRPEVAGRVDTTRILKYASRCHERGHSHPVRYGVGRPARC